MFGRFNEAGIYIILAEHPSTFSKRNISDDLLKPIIPLLITY